MDEKECIEREKAFNAILKLVPKVDGDGYCWVIRGDAAIAIDSIPAADVRPVVRCEQCKYWKRLGNTSHFACTYVLGVEFVRTADDFCSRGEKREES